MEGWVKLYRSMIANGHFGLPANAFKLFIYLILAAAHDDQPNGLKRGEVIATDEIIRNHWEDDQGKRPGSATIARALDHLEKGGYIERVQNDNFEQRRVRVVNYEQYQSTTFKTKAGAANDFQNESRSTFKTKAHDFQNESRLYNVVQEKNNKLVSLNNQPTNTTSKTKAGKVVTRYKDFVAMPTPTHLSRLVAWVEDNEMDPDLVVRAMDIAEEKGKKRVDFVEGILRNWFNQGILTTGDLESQEGDDTNSGQPWEDVGEYDEFVQ